MLRRALVGAAALALLAAPFGDAATANRGDRAAAAAIVTRLGYRPDLKTWDSFFKLNIVIGTYAKSADGYNRRAFFFVGRKYLGTDAKNPSAQLQEVWRDDTTIALLYILYRGSDPNCCPTGGGKIVRFHWNGSRVDALDRIPPRTGPLHR